MESSPVDTLAQLRMFVDGTDTLRAAADRMMRMRDEAIRQADAAGVMTRVELAKFVGVDRSRLYVILANPDPDDEALAEHLFESMAELVQEAVSRWESSDYDGSPDDYFPIEDVLRADP